MAPRGLEGRVWDCLRSALAAAGQERKLIAAMARAEAATFADAVVDSFDGKCATCSRRVSVCLENKRSRFAYWVLCHGRHAERK
mmetsp:Transcript_56553/g.169139  ORF Transcript_56553/g.169139 Transcript_56553/m.169139 type:complete len:84 (-) Transcript_56553:192-443(-)